MNINALHVLKLVFSASPDDLVKIKTLKKLNEVGKLLCP